MNDAYRDIRDGIRAATERPTQPAMPPSGAGLSATQIARLSLEAQQSNAKALEDIRDVVRSTAEALAPVAVQLVELLGPFLAQATADLHRLTELVTVSLERWPLDTPEREG